MNLFLRSFWLSLFAAGIVCFFVVHLWWSTHLARMPALPAFPATRATYVAAYGDSGYTVHYLYRFGLFGLRTRMQHSDILLLGPSHVELGLSAAQLSRELSTAEGRPIHVYNLGVGYGDSLPFDFGILKANDIQEKAALIDLYLPNGGDISAFGQKVNGNSRLSAYLYVTDLWLRAANDWLLDPWLPDVHAKNDAQGHIEIQPVRMLRSFITRSWETGDTCNIWRPETGFIYVNSPPDWNRPFQKIDPARYEHSHDLTLTADMQAKLADRKIRPIYTLIPYDGYPSDKVPATAWPYVPISPDDLHFIDTNHLNAASRKLATHRISLGIEQAGLLSSWLPAPISP